MKPLILIMAVCSFVVQAEEKPKTAPEGTISVDTKDGPYWVDPKFYRLGYTIKKMRYGFPIGSNYNTVKKPEPADTVTEMTEQMIQATQKNAESVVQAKKTILDVQARLGDDGNGEPIKFSEQSPAAALDQGAFDFDRCAINAQVLLKRKMNLDFAITQNSLTGIELINSQRVLEAILTQLQKNRGTGGLPCAAGDALLENVVVDSDKEKIQVMMALAARKNAERTKLKRALALSATAKYPQDVRAAWIPVWKRLSMAAVFTNKSLPTYKSVVTEMKAQTVPRKVEASSGVAKVALNINHDTTALDANIESGLKLLGAGNAND